MAFLYVVYPDISLGYSDGIYAIPNPGGSPPYNDTSLYNVSRYSYFEGPNGLGSISYNAWGRWGNQSGANRIYGLSATSNNYKMSDYSGSYYFYEQSEYKCNLTVYNNLGASQFSPPPPIDNTVQDVNLTLKDNTNNYSYITLGSGAVISLGDGGGTYGPTDASTSTTPLIYRAYWTIVIASQPNFPGALADLTINGTSKFTGQTVNGAGAPTTFAFGTWGTEDMATGYGGNSAGFDFVLTIY